MGSAFRKKGDMDAAIRAYRAGVEAGVYPELLVALGDTLREAEQVAEAVEVLRGATGKYPNAAVTHLALGKALRATGRIEEARQEGKQVLDLVEKYVKTPILREEQVRLKIEARLLLSEIEADEAAVKKDQNG